MTAVTLKGLASVVDRTIFTAKGPIVKSAVPMLTGTNLKVISCTDIYIPTVTFDSGMVGKKIVISGSPNQRNDGSFYIKSVISQQKASLENANFDVVDVDETTKLVVALANQLARNYDQHRTQSGVHINSDTTNIVTAQFAVDVVSSCILLNNLLLKFNSHVQTSATVHNSSDVTNVVSAPSSTNLTSAILMINRLVEHFELHRINSSVHVKPDYVNITTLGPVVPIIGSGSLVGPLTWTIFDPRIGQIADEPSDVNVMVNGTSVSIDAVFGLLGAVVLTAKPTHLSTVTIDYDYLQNPPIQFEKLNSSEFNLNQGGNRNKSGLPNRKYRARSSILNPKNLSIPTVKSSIKPKLVGWKCKSFERCYTATLNDPNTLLLNVPTNKLSYPVLQASVYEKVIRYDPVTFPQNSTDPWTLKGTSSGLKLNLEPSELLITDSDASSGVNSSPAFFTHDIDISFKSYVSAAFRSNVYSWSLDGVFTGICFGISTGSKVSVIGFLVTDANNLSSGILLANNLKKKFNSHITQLSVHPILDTIDSVSIADATDLPSLIILANSLRVAYGAHVLKYGIDNVHQNFDPQTGINSVAPKTQAEALSILNDIRVKLNIHLTSVNVHANNDTVNYTDQIKQIGILTNRGLPQFDTSWDSYANDWTSYKTYRIFQDSDGNPSLFLSGDVTPIVSTNVSNLPSISSLDGRFDPLQQIFFGTIGKPTTSVVGWSFIRADINPVDSNQIGDNKSVNYQPTVVPELDTTAPWIVVGQGGYDRISTNQLVVDSTASAPAQNVAALGLSSGAYRGFLRFEPITTFRSSLSFEFTANVGYYTFSLDNKSSGVFIDDDMFSSHLVFLQSTPTPAKVTGSAYGPFTTLNTAIDTLTISIDSGDPITISFVGAANTASSTIISIINASVGFTFASNNAADTVPNTRISFTSSTSGIDSKIKIISGTAVLKLGFTAGTYIGLDSNPEPKISWFGENAPEFDIPLWTKSGSQTSQMLFRTLRITDAGYFDFLTYSLADQNVTLQTFGPTCDWKFDARLTVQSYTIGASIGSKAFCGVLINIDEGTLGKNLELHLTKDLNNITYASILSFNNSTNSLTNIVSVPFAWDDKKPHTFNVFTSKLANTMILMIDGVVMTTFQYSSLLSGTVGPSLSFGSGGLAIANIDLKTAKSTVDWHSVSIFRDQKVSDPTAASRRYIGLYKGGDEKSLSSYYLHQVDWASLHTYRIVRDPSSTVSVYLDGAKVPVISVNYDILSLPSVASSFLKGMTGGRPTIAFGSFSPYEIDRTNWTGIRYSIGKLSITNRLVPPHQSINQANVVVSPDHLTTKTSHSHFGFKVYSEGTPIDDFMSLSTEKAFLTLGEGTPPVSMTQDLESRGGLVQSFVPVGDVSSVSFVNQPGFLSNFDNDAINVLTSQAGPDVTTSTALLVTRSNDLRAKFNLHLIQTTVHTADDVINTITAPVSTNLSTAITLINQIKTRFNAHLIETGVHFKNDTTNQITTPASTDLNSAILLVEAIASAYNSHRSKSKIHNSNDTTNQITTSIISGLPQTISVLNDIKLKYNLHIASVTAHLVPDLINFIATVDATDTATAITLANNLKTKFNLHSQSTTFHAAQDSIRTITSPASTDLESLFELSNELSAHYNAHLSSFVTNPNVFGELVPTSVHVTNDTINPSSVKTTYGQTIDLMQSFVNSFNGHIKNSQSSVKSHIKDDLTNKVDFTALFSFVPPVKFDKASIISQVKTNKTKFNSHLIQSGIHNVLDSWSTEAVSDPTNITSCITLLNDIRTNFNSHLSLVSYHQNPDTVNVLTSQIVIDPLASSIIVANDLQGRMNAHFNYKRSHAHVDVSDFILVQPATDTNTLIALVNEIQTKFNIHRTQTAIHVANDTTNVATSPIATDLQSAITSLNELVSKYNNHRVQSGVHGSSVFVRIDPPSGVLYNSTKFFQSPTGDSGYLAPFSDDETLKMDGIKYQADHNLAYQGVAIPENMSIVSLGVAPFPIIDGDVLNVFMDGSLTPVVVTFQSTDTSVINVIGRINGTPGIPAGYAKDNNDGRIKLTSIISTSASSIILTGSAVAKLGIESTTTPWTIINSNSSAVSIVPMTSGITDYIRYGTTGTGSTTTYRNKTGITDAVSTDFDATFTIRINSVDPDVLGDTGIYFGVSGIAGPGFTAAVGFDLINGIRFIKMVDLLSGRNLFQRPFNWGDGLFHTYKISKVTARGGIQFTIIS